MTAAEAMGQVPPLLLPPNGKVAVTLKRARRLQANLAKDCPVASDSAAYNNHARMHTLNACLKGVWTVHPAPCPKRVRPAEGALGTLQG